MGAKVPGYGVGTGVGVIVGAGVGCRVGTGVGPGGCGRSKGWNGVWRRRLWHFSRRGRLRYFSRRGCFGTSVGTGVCGALVLATGLGVVAGVRWATVKDLLAHSKCTAKAVTAKIRHIGSYVVTKYTERMRASCFPLMIDQTDAYSGDGKQL